jgi:alginate O-acetyltransferase complex protein AlgI
LDFWRRWHMSLSSWIRDYVFLPLASLSPRYSWRFVALVISMGFFGLWHGARLTFLCWGLYQGVLLVGNRLVQLGERTFARPVPAFLSKTVGWISTFVCISLGWLLFRARDLSTASTMLQAVFTPNHYFHLGLRPNFYLLTLLFLIGYFAHVGGAKLLEHVRTRTPAAPVLPLFQPLYYTAVILAIIVWSSQQSAFVYFQF